MTNPEIPWRRLIVAVSLMLMALTAPAAAQAPDGRSFNPQIFHAAPGPDEFVTVESATPLPHKAWGVGLYLNYSRNPISLLANDVATGQQTHLYPQAHVAAADVWAAVGLVDRLQLALALPMTLYQTGEDINSPNPIPNGTHLPASTGFALGDPRVHVKLRLYGKDRGFEIAVSHWLSIPVGDDKNFGGEKHFTGFAGEPRVLLGYEGRRWRVGVSLGFHWRAAKTVYLGTVAGQQVTWGGAVAVDVVRGRLTILAELFGHSNSFDSATANGGAIIYKDSFDTPLEIDLAAKITLARNLRMTLGAGYGVVPALGSAQPRAFVGLVYARAGHDRDADGVPDEDDQCPDVPEDRDGFKDEDGCPDPDNDGDGIPDAKDKCPNEAEDFDGFQDDDGCPEPDNDGDGVPDVKDACPADKEDGKPPRPSDGCPFDKTDSDGDGIPDAKDRCPLEPEDKDGFADDDGCPDLDNDQDGFPDESDKCPNEPGTRWSDGSGDCCPEPAGANPAGRRGAPLKAAEPSPDAPPPEPTDGHGHHHRHHGSKPHHSSSGSAHHRHH